MAKLQNSKGKVAASVSEATLLKRSIAKVSSKTQQPRRGSAKPLFDAWGAATQSSKLKLAPSTVVRRESFVPAVVPACPALSVNPTEGAFNEMILREAEKEMASTKARNKRVVTPLTPEAKAESPAPASTANETPLEPASSERKTKAQKLKEKRHKQMLREHEQKRQEKEARRALQNKAARMQEEEEQAKRREQRLTTKVSRIIEEASGSVSIARGAGGRLAPIKEQIPTEISSSLRRIIPGDAVLDRRASLLKRRLIEQVPEINTEYKEKIRYAKYTANKARKLVDSDAKARCVLLG